MGVSFDPEGVAMCFNQPMSFAFATLGLIIAIYIKFKTTNTKYAIGVFWFFLMELLQGFQYFWIDDCDHPMNQFLTLLGFIHICYQPYFTHVINSSLSRNPKFLMQYDIILRLCLLGGTLLFLRYVVAEYSQMIISSDLTDWMGVAPAVGSCRTIEWLRGEKLCTFSGRYHLAWSVPMYDPTYWSPSAAIHSFLMFGPFFASWITPNLMEQASIWCFFSIAQIAIMLFIIRDQLILSFGKSSSGDKNRVVGAKAKSSPKPQKAS